jgi:DNA-binding GntR family transcriptional regulator
VVETMPLEPIRKRSAEMQAADALRHYVVSGAARPGSRLTEIRLSEAFGLSRATIRTALHQVANEGLVVQVPYTGWEVASLSSRDAWELYTLRASLETMGARLLVDRLTPEMEESLRAAFDALVEACDAGDEGAVADKDLGLHKTIVELSGHRRLQEQFRLVEQQIRLYIAWSDALMPSRAEIVDTHHPIIAAIIARDGERAERILRDHNETAGRILVQYLDERNGSGTEANVRPLADAAKPRQRGGKARG